MRAIRSPVAGVLKGHGTFWAILPLSLSLSLLLLLSEVCIFSKSDQIVYP